MKIQNLCRLTLLLALGFHQFAMAQSSQQRSIDALASVRADLDLVVYRKPDGARVGWKVSDLTLAGKELRWKETELHVHSAGAVEVEEFYSVRLDNLDPPRISNESNIEFSCKIAECITVTKKGEIANQTGSGTFDKAALPPVSLKRSKNSWLYRDDEKAKRAIVSLSKLIAYNSTAR